MSGVTVAPCATCGEVPEAGARFCENCGAALGPAAVPTAGSGDTSADGAPAAAGSEASDPPSDAAHAPVAPRRCADCGGTIADDGYCEQCGKPAENARDHWAERPASWVGGVCDRGIRHVRNEDAMALTAAATPGTFAALVVCDGVSAAPDSDIASLAASRAARDVLANGGPDGASPITGDVTERMRRWSELMVTASVAANDAVKAAVGEKAERAEPPSCTYVAAVVDGPLVVAGWVGDSRVYWIPDAGEAHQISVDDSWAQEMMAQGMSRRSAENSAQSHAITRWLGPDSQDFAARCAPTLPDSPGWVLVCSDGLWNYCSPANDLAALVRSTQATMGSDPEAIAGELVRWANGQGGRDNITAALARFDNLPAEPVASAVAPASPPA